MSTSCQNDDTAGFLTKSSELTRFWLCVHQAQRDHKRLVTAYWLNDVLLRKKMTPPWLALHYPSAYGSNKPCCNQVRTAQQCRL